MFQSENSWSNHIVDLSAKTSLERSHISVKTSLKQSFGHNFTGAITSFSENITRATTSSNQNIARATTFFSKNIAGANTSFSQKNARATTPSSKKDRCSIRNAEHSRERKDHGDFDCCITAPLSQGIDGLRVHESVVDCRHCVHGQLVEAYI